MRFPLVSLSLLVLGLQQEAALGFAPESLSARRCTALQSSGNENYGRRSALSHLAFGTASLLLPSVASAEESIFAPKFVQEYPDFEQSSEGWSFKDVKVGSGESPKVGDRVVYEWSGYTIGYFGRPFEAKG